jgi:cytosolic 5'-nucleotidase 3
MQQLLKNFKYINQKSVEEKIKLLISEGKSKLHIVSDFDRTLTTGIKKEGGDSSTWALLETHLSEILQKKSLDLYNYYRPLEIAGNLTEKDAIKWWKDAFEILIQGKIKWSNLAKDVETKLSARKGTKKLFKTCEDHQIPILIISAGVRDVIELWCQKLDLKPTLILSTDLIFDEKGIFVSWKKDSLIHVLNKKEKGHEEIKKIREKKPNIILLGDSLDDTTMVDDGKNVLKILIDDPGIGKLQKDNVFYKKVFSKFDLCLQTENLQPVINLINQISR